MAVCAAFLTTTVCVVVSRVALVVFLQARAWVCRALGVGDAAAETDSVVVAGVIELLAVRGDAEGAFKLALAIVAPPAAGAIDDTHTQLAAAFEEALVARPRADAIALRDAAAAAASGGVTLCHEVRTMFSIAAEHGGRGGVEERYGGALLRALAPAVDAAMARAGGARGAGDGARCAPSRWTALDADGRKRVLALATGAFFEVRFAVYVSVRVSGHTLWRGSTHPSLVARARTARRDAPLPRARARRVRARGPLGVRAGWRRACVGPPAARRCVRPRRRALPLRLRGEQNKYDSSEMACHVLSKGCHSSQRATNDHRFCL